MIFIFHFGILRNIIAAVSLTDFQKKIQPECEYSIYLQNGDIISGKIIEILHELDNNNNNIVPTAIKLASLVGNIKIYEDEIQKIYLTKTMHGGNHRAFIMPTANPINNNFFLGSYELFALYSGVGISNLVSITAGTTLLPRVFSNNSTTNSNAYYNENIFLVNTKLSLPNLEFPDSTSMAFALGANLTFLGKHNLTHIYGLATYNTQDASQFTVGLFYKAANQEFPMEFTALGNDFLIDYPDGTFGIAANTEVKFSNRKDLVFIGEFWNNNLSKPTNSLIILGLRLKARNFSSDFGILVSTQPFVAPLVNFIWTF